MIVELLLELLTMSSHPVELRTLQPSKIEHINILWVMTRIVIHRESITTNQKQNKKILKYMILIIPLFVPSGANLRMKLANTIKITRI